MLFRSRSLETLLNFIGYHDTHLQKGPPTLPYSGGETIMHQLYLVGHINHTYYQTHLPQMANDCRILHSIGTDGYRTDLAIFYLNDYTNVYIIIQS